MMGSNSVHALPIGTMPAAYRYRDCIVANCAFLPMRQRLITGSMGRIPFMNLGPCIGGGRDKSRAHPP